MTSETVPYTGKPADQLSVVQDDHPGKSLTVVQDGDHTDIGMEYFLQSQQMDPVKRDIIAKRVLRKIDFTSFPQYVFI